jgi:Reverse transcriptase (RNA-dependent DNA polymerase)
LIYVDDIIIIENNLEEIREVKTQLRNVFDIKDLKLLKYFLEIETAHSPKGLFVTTKIYFGLVKENRKIRV